MRLVLMTLLLATFGALGPAAAGPMPGVDLKELDQEDIASLSKLMTNGACPCNHKKSLLECIEAKSCPAATDLANFGADKIREGLGGNQVEEAVVKKYLSDHVSYEFDLSNTPHKGPANAKIVMVEFADFQCPHCRRLWDGVHVNGTAVEAALFGSGVGTVRHDCIVSYGLPECAAACSSAASCRKAIRSRISSSLITLTSPIGMRLKACGRFWSTTVVSSARMCTVCTCRGASLRCRRPRCLRSTRSCCKSSR